MKRWFWSWKIPNMQILAWKVSNMQHIMRKWQNNQRRNKRAWDSWWKDLGSSQNQAPNCQELGRESTECEYLIAEYSQAMRFGPKTHVIIEQTGDALPIRPITCKIQQRITIHVMQFCKLLKIRPLMHCWVSFEFECINAFLHWRQLSQINYCHKRQHCKEILPFINNNSFD
jgi:hypothetical protein